MHVGENVCVGKNMHMQTLLSAPPTVGPTCRREHLHAGENVKCVRRHLSVSENVCILKRARADTVAYPLCQCLHGGENVHMWKRTSLHCTNCPLCAYLRSTNEKLNYNSTKITMDKKRRNENIMQSRHKL